MGLFKKKINKQGGKIMEPQQRRLFPGNPQPQQKPKESGEGCRIKIERDAHGKIVGMRSNGKCSKNEIDFLREKEEAETSDEY